VWDAKLFIFFFAVMIRSAFPRNVISTEVHPGSHLYAN